MQQHTVKHSGGDRRKRNVMWKYPPLELEIKLPKKLARRSPPQYLDTEILTQPQLPVLPSPTPHTHPLTRT